MDAACEYRFRDGSPCPDKEEGGGLCFWHNPDPPKTGADIKRRLEEMHAAGRKLEGFQLENADLENSNLVRAVIHKANMKRANLKNAHLYKADLSGAVLFKSALDGANLKSCNLQGADLLGVDFGEAEMDNVILGPRDIVRNEADGEHLLKEGNREQAYEKFSEAEGIYRRIKNNFKARGLSYEAGKYHYREMVAKRRQMSPFSLEYFYSLFIDFSTAYGESPYRIFWFSSVYILLFAVMYGFIGIADAGEGAIHTFSEGLSAGENLTILFHALYYSMVTFTTVGYGDFTTVGIGKAVAMVEAYSGPFLISLFVITIYKRYMER